MMLVTHKKGKHHSNPRRLKIGKMNGLIGQFVMSRTAAYTLEGNDQDDWNKLIGISFHLLTSHKNSVMIGWRYCPDLDDFEFCAYWHKNGERGFTNTLLSVKPNEPFFGNIIMKGSRATVSLRAKDNSGTFSIDFDKPNKCRRLITPWFGGNNAAPGTITFQQDIKIVKNEIDYDEYD